MYIHILNDGATAKFMLVFSRSDIIVNLMIRAIWHSIYYMERTR